MMDGTRFSSREPRDPSARHSERSYTRDLHLAPLVTAAMTFIGNTVSAPGIFAAFQPGEIISVSGTNLNNGLFLVLDCTVDVLTLEPMPKPETSTSCSIRTAANVANSPAYFLLGGSRMLLAGQPVIP